MSTNVTEAAILGWNVPNTYVNMTGHQPRWNIPGYYYQYPDSYYNYDYYHNESYLDYWFDASLENKNIIGSIYVIMSAIQFLLYARILTVKKIEMYARLFDDLSDNHLRQRSIQTTRIQTNRTSRFCRYCFNNIQFQYRIVYDLL